MKDELQKAATPCLQAFALISRLCHVVLLNVQQNKFLRAPWAFLRMKQIKYSGFVNSPTHPPKKKQNQTKPKRTESNPNSKQKVQHKYMLENCFASLRSAVNYRDA